MYTKDNLLQWLMRDVSAKSMWNADKNTKESSRVFSMKGRERASDD
jgi:hypothetical protein